MAILIAVFEERGKTLLRGLCCSLVRLGARR
jgi:hypothetical protein